MQTVRGCPKHCSFCSVWRTDGQEPRQRGVDPVVREIVELRRRGFRFIALADDNFYPVTFDDLAPARRRTDPTRLQELEALRDERFELMAQLAQLPDDLVFYTQITMEAAEDPEFLEAMRRAQIRGALVGVESVTEAGLKDVYKGFNLSGDALVARLRAFRRHGIHVLGSFIFGLPSDGEDTFDATVALAERADLTFAQFVLLTPFPGTIDFEKWAAQEVNKERHRRRRSGHPHWLIPMRQRPKLLRAAPDDVARGDPRRHAGRLGSVLQLEQRVGSLARREVAEGAAWRSCWCRSCIARCTPIPASPPTARGSRSRRAGRATSGWRFDGCFLRSPCLTCRCPRRARCPRANRPSRVTRETGVGDEVSLHLVKRHLPIAFSLLAGFAESARAQKAPPSAIPQAQVERSATTRRLMSAYRIPDGETIAIDGRLDEGPWQRAVPAAGSCNRIPRTASRRRSRPKSASCTATNRSTWA